MRRPAGAFAAAVLLGLLAPGAAAAPSAAPVTGAAAGAAPGEVRLEVAAEPSAIHLGDPVRVTVRLVYPQGTRITAFAPEGDLGDLALLDRRVEPPYALDLGRVEEVRTLRITAYQLGAHEVPALHASYADASGKEVTVASAPVRFEVTSILTSGDTTPADIKPPAAMPEGRLWPWLLLALALAGACLWAWWRRRRRRPAAEQAAPAVPARPPHEIAYAELQRLLSSGLLEEGRVKEFYIELAEIVKRYLTARFGVETFERTSSEILEALRAARVPVRVTGAVGEFFGACDLVKFAKHLPRPDETRAAVEQAYRLVDETKPAPAPREEPGGGALAVAGGGRAQVGGSA